MYIYMHTHTYIKYKCMYVNMCVCVYRHIINANKTY